MRPLPIGGLMMLASCTLLVPIDDDVTSGASRPRDAGADTSPIANDAGTDAPTDAGERFGPPRDGCPNGVSLDPDLEAYYPFDETEGSVLHDCSQKARDLASLTAVVPTWSADGHLHGAADFDGVDGCFGSDDPSLDRFESQPFSVSVWVLARQFFEESGRWIIGHKISPKGWHIGVDDPDRFELDLEWNDGTKDQKTEISAIGAVARWTHVVTTYSEKGEAAIYKDGVLAGKKSADGVPTAFGTDPKVLLHIGCRNAKAGIFDGKLDELRIYPRVIAEEQIRALAEAR